MVLILLAYDLHIETKEYFISIPRSILERGISHSSMLLITRGSKGGKHRLSPVVGSKKEVDLVISLCKNANGKIFKRVPSKMDVHSFRAYDTEECCLSLLGGPRKCKRYKTIKVQYQTLDMQMRIKTYTGWTAQIIQHEVDHCNGVLI